MVDVFEQVQRLAEMAEVSIGRRRGYDWSAIENSLGSGLPSDYKMIADLFPEGCFRMFVEVWLPEKRDAFIGARAEAVMDGIRQIEDDYSRNLSFPYSVFPGDGGLLPCGSLRSSGHIFWIADDGNPDEWPLVLSDDGYDHWERFNGSLCNFLTELSLGEFDASEFRDHSSWNGQEFVDINSRPIFTSGS